ncbi:zinc finger CCCH domain-containing protein 39 [Lathyrus oleraceus]|uniref:C3H1-type domain-containing protein n=2 Tax=Pisum sativum TaxID=3888 RepID=A0A9D4XCH0_PEA|nr:zinc finger CCCH domain-containing protein 39-like [Pisum sativum]KAI5416305.1 hypothetical protein KIW84_041380 [Pisum sativum]
MSYWDNIPTFKMSPPQFSSSSRGDIIEVRPQFPMSNQGFEHNQRFEPHSASDHLNSFKRPRMSDNSHSNALMGPPPNRPTGNIFFKTRICTKFGFGSCRNGETCSFAHGVEEIRQPPPNWQELVRPRTEEQPQLGGNWNDDQKIIHKMKLCKKYYNGEECPYGDKCNFLHEDPAKFRDDSWKTRESSAISIGFPKSFGDGSNSLESNRAGTKPARGTCWKTKMCLKWMNTGSCPFRDGCHFAHGDAELLVPGGGIEAEAAVAMTNSPKAVIPTLPTTALSGSAHDALPASVPSVTEEEKKIKKELLWKKLNKMNHIYGDWIDDLPLDRPDLSREP